MGKFEIQNQNFHSMYYKLISLNKRSWIELKSDSGIGWRERSVIRNAYRSKLFSIPPPLICYFDSAKAQWKYKSIMTVIYLYGEKPGISHNYNSNSQVSHWF